MNRCIRRVVAALLACSALAGTLGCANLLGQAGTGGLVISEVCSSNRESLIDPVWGAPDWIELHNTSAQSINLFGYMLTDSVQNAGKLNILPDVTVPADGYVVLYANKAEMQTEAGDAILLSFALSKNGDSLFLLSNANEIVDEVAVPALSRDVSYARKDDGSFGFCATPTPGAANAAALFDTLAAAEEYLSGGAQHAVTFLYLNEVVSKNDGSYLCDVCGARADWVELYNASDEAVDLSGYTLSDSPDARRTGNLTGFSIEPGGYLTVLCSPGGAACTGGHATCAFGISRGGETLYLFDALGAQAAMLEVPALEQDCSYARRDDGSYGFCLQPTPGEKNTTLISDAIESSAMDASDPVRISEVLPDNAYSLIDADGDRSDWVELYNSSDQPVGLAGCYLSDNPQDPKKWAFPDVSIPAGGYLIVFLSGKQKAGTAELHATFSLSADETLVFYNAANNRTDSVPIPDLRENVSIGRADDGSPVYYAQPTPGGANAQGFSDADRVGFFLMDGLFISEVCAIHRKGSTENDWIELYNGSQADMDLTGYYLSDDPDDPKKYCVQGVTVKAGGYAVIETSADAEPSGSVAGFGISPDGETLLLSDPAGNPVDVFVSGVTSRGMTSGRIETDNTVARCFFSGATRGKRNANAAYTGYAPEPVFSQTALYHTEAFTLTLSCADSDAAIYYTLNGSTPDASSKLYTEPLTVTSSCVVRAVSVKAGALDSKPATCHYLFEAQHTLPVVCIAMSRDALSDVWSPSRHSDIVERESDICYYEPDGTLGVSFVCGLKAKGQGTLTYSQKSLSINLRGSLGQDCVIYAFFDEYPYTAFHNLVLRNSGQDATGARIRDAFASRIVQGLHVEAAMTRPVVVYVNGRYYGLYDLGEDLNAGYLETHYGVSRDAVDVIRRNEYALSGSKREIVRVRAYAREHNFASDTRYEQLIQWVDADYFIDYVICQTFFANADMYNQKYWRSQDYTVRWRPVLYDLDFAFMQGKRNLMHSYFVKAGIASPNGTVSNMDLYCALRENAGWRQKFVERYVEVVMTVFAADRLLATLDQMVEEMRPEMPRQIARWGYPSSMSRWENEIADLRQIVETRPAVILGQVQAEFGVSDAEMQAYIAKYTP